MSGKLYRSQLETFKQGEAASVEQAVNILKGMPHVKFDETFELAFKLGIDPRQSDQNVRGAISLPHGSGKQVRVVVIASDAAAEAARAAGADFVGYEELLEKIQGGWMDFDAMIATPAAMQKVRPLGRALGPRGLMPNPKTGTVTDDTAAAVRELKAGRVEYRTDRGGCVHVPVGKISFESKALVDNCNAVIQAILRAKPASAKGIFLQAITASTTMSPGVKLDVRLFA